MILMFFIILKISYNWSLNLKWSIDHKIMFFAVQNNHLSLVYEMIKRGNSPMSVDENGNNLMLLAIKH